MFASEYRLLTDEQLNDQYEDLKEEIYRLRISHASGELVDTSQFKKTRANIARIQTVLRERQLAAALAEEEK